MRTTVKTRQLASSLYHLTPHHLSVIPGSPNGSPNLTPSTGIRRVLTIMVGNTAILLLCVRYLAKWLSRVMPFNAIAINE